MHGSPVDLDLEGNATALYQYVWTQVVCPSLQAKAAIMSDYMLLAATARWQDLMPFQNRATSVVCQMP